MQMLSLLWGILAIIGMVVGFFPCLGSLNWLNIPFAGVGIIVSGIALGTEGDRSKSCGVAGLVCCIVALFFGIIRLALGGGIF